MATVTKTWTFTADTEGLVDVGDSANLAWAFDAGSTDCVAANGAYTASERSRRASTGQTWETWGVPAGATVTDVQVTSWQRRCWAVSGATSHTMKMRVVDSAGATIHTAGDLISVTLPTVIDSAWAAQGAGTSRAVNAGKQASTTDVRLELEYGCVRTASGTPLDTGVDTIALVITYTTGGTTQVSTSRRVVYNVQAQVAASRRVNYGVLAQVAATRRVVYNVLAPVTASRRINYGVLAQVTATRRLVYAVLATVLATRRVTYNVLAPVSGSRRVVYSVTASTTQVAATRRITYGVTTQVAGLRRVNYAVGDPVVALGRYLALVWVGS